MMAAKKEYWVLTETLPDKLTKGKWTHITSTRVVRLMAQAEGYAMVRNQGCMPFCVSVKKLTKYVPPQSKRTEGLT
jgi:hypothetical protein